MRASTVVAILSLIAWVALSVALPLPAIQYVPLSCCIYDAQVLSFFSDLSIPMSTRYAGNRAWARFSRAFPSPPLALPTPSPPRPHPLPTPSPHRPHPRPHPLTRTGRRARSSPRSLARTGCRARPRARAGQARCTRPTTPCTRPRPTFTPPLTTTTPSPNSLLNPLLLPRLRTCPCNRLLNNISKLTADGAERQPSGKCI